MKEANKEAARELACFTVNDSELYRHAQACILNLARKMKRGTYDADKALILWGHHATMASKKYVKYFCASDEKYFSIFNVETRKLAAKEIAEHYQEELTETHLDLCGF